MEMKHTPGPWRIFTPDDYEGPEGLPGLGIESENGSAVVWYADRAESGIANEEDAPLLAAAPELLDELLMLCNMLDGEQVSVGIEARVCFARAVIAKATGMTANA